MQRRRMRPGAWPLRGGVLLLAALLAVGTAGARPLRVGIEHYEPYTFTDSAGRPAGFCVDLLEAIAREQHLELEFVAEPWGEILSDFKAGRIDILANVGFTPERAEYMGFTMPHSNLPAGVFVRPELASVRSFEELRGKRFAVTVNALVHEWLMRNHWTEAFVPAINTNDSLRLLDAGRADVVVASRLVAAKYIREAGLRHLVLIDCEVPNLTYRYQFGVHRQETDLLYRLNSGLEDLHASGEYGRIYERWLGLLEPRPLRFRDLEPYLVPAGLVVLFVAFALLRQRQLLRRLALQAEALRASEERYRQFFEEDLAGAFIAAPDGRILACNPAFAQLLGFGSAQAAAGSNVFDLLLHATDRPDLLRRLQNRQPLQNARLDLLRRDGTPVHVIANAFGRFAGSGDLREIQGYLIDHTESRRLEDQLRQSQKMEAVGQLAGGVAHDFNNLLTAILGYSTLLLEVPELDTSSRASIAEIRDAAQRAANLTRQLLAFSRKELVRPKVLNPGRVVENLEKMLRRLIGEDVRLTLELPASSGSIRIDPGQFEQVIVNLAVNARDAMPQGGRLGIELEDVVLDQADARALLNLRPGPYVCLTVTDTGCGMTPEVQEHIFEPFFTTKGLGKGTGLGLAMVYGIVKENGGHIAVSSKVDEGSTFRLYFPQVEPAPAEPVAAGETALGLHGTEMILLVEDNEVVRRVTRQILHEHGHRVMEAADGAQALRLFAAQPQAIDLVLSDLIMPEMNGIVLAERIRALDPAQPLVFMSGYADDKLTRRDGAAAGIPVIDKPFTPHALMRQIRQALDQSGQA